MAPEKIARIVQVTFNVNSDAYDSFIAEKVRVKLAGPNPDTVKGPESKEGRPVLRKETSPDKQPEWWIHVVLKGENGEAPKVAIRNDNVYIIGFTNSQGTWYQLSKTKTFPKLVDEKAAWAGFDGHYQTLVGGVDNLTKLKVNKKEVADAAAKLWNYNKPTTKLGGEDGDDDDDETALLGFGDDQYKVIKTAVATLCVAVCEAARFIDVSRAVAGNWDEYRAPITEQLVKYIKNWGDCSKALLQWKSSGYKDDTPFKDLARIGITNGDVALDVVALVKLIVIRSSMTDEEELLAYAELPRHGRYMAEVFAVRVPAASTGGDPPSGTISFHGGHCCSDVIYSWTPQEEHISSQQACDSQGNIVLTGPSVATSAYSPIALSFDLHDGDDDDRSSRVVCDSIGGNFSNYNRAIVETVQTGYGPAQVTYAVLSNGVQGRVAVKLARLPASMAAGDEEDASGVLGRIAARSKLFDVGCVLFYSEGDRGVCVESGGLVPLARDALAVPLHMPLTFELHLRRCSGDEIVRGAIEFSPAIDGQHTECLVGDNGAELEVTVSWSEYPW